MQKILLIVEDWEISTLDIIFLIMLFVVIAFLFSHRNSKKNLNRRHQRIFKHIAKEGKITTYEASKILKVSTDTALRELAKLVKMNLLARSGAGRSVCYVRK